MQPEPQQSRLGPHLYNDTSTDNSHRAKRHHCQETKVNSGHPRGCCMVLGNHIKIKHIVADNGWFQLDVRGWSPIGSYIYLNVSSAYYDQWTIEVKEKIGKLKRREEVLVCGDLNAKVFVWGRNMKDRRGTMLFEMTAELDLVVLTEKTDLPSLEALRHR